HHETFPHVRPVPQPSEDTVGRRSEEQARGTRKESRRGPGRKGGRRVPSVRATEAPSVSAQESATLPTSSRATSSRPASCLAPKSVFRTSAPTWRKPGLESSNPSTRNEKKPKSTGPTLTGLTNSLDTSRASNGM